MANTDNILQYHSQIDFQGQDYLDPKMSPAKTKADLDKCKVSDGTAFEGLEKIVLEDETLGGKIVKYMFDGTKWVVTSLLIECTDDGI